MRVLNVQGTSKTGKTTTVSHIIKELTKRGYSVGTIKEIHWEGFTLETEGSNTHTHKTWGATQVTARGLTETDIMFDYKVDIETLLDMYTQDYVVIEGNCNANCPNIITGKTERDLEGQLNQLTIAASGVISNYIDKYRGLPVINPMTDIEKLVTLIEEKTPSRMANFPEECCTSCGYDCKGLTAAIIKGQASEEMCIAKGQKIQVFIDGKEIDMVPFVQQIVGQVTTSVVSCLDGYCKDKEILVKIKP